MMPDRIVPARVLAREVVERALGSLAMLGSFVVRRLSMRIGSHFVSATLNAWCFDPDCYVAWIHQAGYQALRLMNHFCIDDPQDA